MNDSASTTEQGFPMAWIRCAVLLLFTLASQTAAGDPPRKQKPWCDFETPNCPATDPRPKAEPSGGYKGPGIGKGVTGGQQTASPKKFDSIEDAMTDIRQHCASEISALQNQLLSPYSDPIQTAANLSSDIRSTVTATRAIVEQSLGVRNGWGKLHFPFNICTMKRRLWQFEQGQVARQPTPSASCEAERLQARANNSEYIFTPGNNNPLLGPVILASTSTEFFEAIWLYTSGPLPNGYLESEEGVRWLKDEAVTRRWFGQGNYGNLTELGLCWARVRLAEQRERAGRTGTPRKSSLAETRTDTSNSPEAANSPSRQVAIVNPQPKPDTTRKNADDLIRRALERAEELQQRTDEDAVSGRPKKNIIEAQASHCISLDHRLTLYGGFANSCNFDVNFSFCNVGMSEKSWAAEFNCAAPRGMGTDQVKAGRSSTQHTNGANMTYWAGCRAPAMPLDLKYTGSGVSFRCR